MPDQKLLPGVPFPGDQQNNSTKGTGAQAVPVPDYGYEQNLAALPMTSITSLPYPWGQEVALLDGCQSEFERVNTELEELRLLIRQSAQEVEKLNQRKVLVAARLHEMEEHLEHYSRQDIRATYIEAGEAEMRAFMLGEQREQWLAKAQMYEHYLHFLDRVIEVLPLVAPPGTPGFMEHPPQLPNMREVASEFGTTMPWQTPIAAAPNDLSQQIATRLSPGHDIDPPGSVAAVYNAPASRELLGLPGTGTLSRKVAEQTTLTRIIQAEEHLRQHVAQQLHDGPAQTMANVVLAAEVCEKLLMTEPQHVMEELSGLKRTVNITLQETRKLIFELHPMTLADLGLIDTLKRYANEIGVRYGVQMPVKAPQIEPPLTQEARVAIFRVAQEAVANAIKYSRTTFIQITLDVAAGGLVLVVEDTGTGFDVDAALARAKAHQIAGLLRMQERAEMLGGWLRIESAYERGTRVELSVPL